MVTKTTLLRAVTALSVFIVHPLLTSSHTLLRKRSDTIIDVQLSSFTAQDYISDKIISKLLPVNNTNSTSVSPIVCIPQEDKLKLCYKSLSEPFNAIKCSECIFGNVNPTTQIITCPHNDYCSSVSQCMEGQCPKDCVDEFYEVLNCIWKEAGCSSTTEGGGGCDVTKKKVVVDPSPPNNSDTATNNVAGKAVGPRNGNNPCGECSTSNGGAGKNFCGSLNTTFVQDVCSSETVCKSQGFKCQVCTEIVNNDGYGGKSIVGDNGNGAYICVKNEENAEKSAIVATDSSSTPSSSSSRGIKKKNKGTNVADNNTSSSERKSGQKSATDTPFTTSAKPKGGFCYSRAEVLGNCVFSKDTSPDCLSCIQSGTEEHTASPTCKQVEQQQFCTNIATCAKQHCGNCSFEFYAGLNCALQKIRGCEQFSCAIDGGGIMAPPLPYSSSSSRRERDDEVMHSLREFQDEAWRKFEINVRKVVMSES